MAEWVCRQSGDCCRTANAVVVTPGELAELRKARPEVAVVTRRVDETRLEILGDAGCPYYDAGCTVYPVRPGVCRGWGCFRKAGDLYTGQDGLLGRIKESAGVRRRLGEMVADADAWTREHP